MLFFESINRAQRHRNCISTHLLAALLLLSASLGFSFSHQTSNQQCYNFDGSPSTDTPCFPEQDASPCCASGDVCLENNLCVSHTTFYTGSCTDETWFSDECPLFCSDSLDLIDGPTSVRICDLSRNTWCCNSGSIACTCEKGSVFTLTGNLEATTTIEGTNEVVVETVVLPSSFSATTPKTASPTSTHPSSTHPSSNRIASLIANSSTTPNSPLSLATPTISFTPKTTTPLPGPTTSSPPTSTSTATAARKADTTKLVAGIGVPVGLILISGALAILLRRYRSRHCSNLGNYKAELPARITELFTLGSNSFFGNPNIRWSTLAPIPSAMESAPTTASHDHEPGERNACLAQEMDSNSEGHTHSERSRLDSIRGNMQQRWRSTNPSILADALYFLPGFKHHPEHVDVSEDSGHTSMVAQYVNPFFYASNHSEQHTPCTPLEPTTFLLSPSLSSPNSSGRRTSSIYSGGWI